MSTMARIADVAPAETLEGLKAKTLATMWECMPACTTSGL
jgi:hypothetical protein